MKLKRSITRILSVCIMTMIFSLAVMAASESLNGGGATWYGGEDSDGILFSKVWDNEVDGLAYNVTVWVKDDEGNYSEKTGTTDAVGEDGEVKVTRASTHSNPFVPKKCGYKDFTVVSAD